ncbi:MAG: YlbF family regulator, partial [Clostridia bacterium]|nr:YlbF family regulator [Clostridia bacterium]
MDAVIAKARELGALLQQDERYLKFAEVQKANEEDKELNELIARIQLVQMSFQHEASKEDKNEQKLQAYDKEFGEIYTKIMANPNMQAFEKARGEIDELMNYINAIFALCLQGEDPAT